MNVTDERIHMLRNAATTPRPGKNLGDGITTGLATDPSELRTGKTGGYQAIGLALAAGSPRVILVAYDMRFKNGRSHWHGDHGPGLRNEGEKAYTHEFAPGFQTLVAYPIVNATPESALTCFPMVDLATELAA